MNPHRGQYHLCILFALVTMLLCAVGSWLIIAESSPFHTYFLWHVSIPNLFRSLHTVPLIFAILVSGNAHQASPIAFWTVAAVQWFLIGFGVSLVFTALLQRLNRNDRNA